MYVYIYAYVCVFMCMYVRIELRKYVRTYLCVCVCARMYVCTPSVHYLGTDGRTVLEMRLCHKPTDAKCLQHSVKLLSVC